MASTGCSPSNSSAVSCTSSVYKHNVELTISCKTKQDKMHVKGDKKSHDVLFWDLWQFANKECIFNLNKSGIMELNVWVAMSSTLFYYHY